MSRSSEATGTDFATLKEVRAALERFRAAGKTILAYNMNWRNEIMSSVANTIVLNPLVRWKSTVAFVPDWSTGEVRHWRSGNSGWEVQGRLNRFLLTKLSPGNKRRNCWAMFGEVACWGKSRKLNPQQLQAIADNQAVLMADQI